MRILVIEDDPTWAGQVGDLLREEGCEVTLTESAEDALSFLSKTSALPELILLDLVLGKMDGWAFYRQLRVNDRWSGIPVMVMTAAQVPEVPLSGIVAFLRKRAEAETLQEVRERLRAWRHEEEHRAPERFQLIVPPDMKHMLDTFSATVREDIDRALNNAAQLVTHELPLTSTWLQAVTGGDEPTLVVRVDDYRVLVQLNPTLKTITVIAVLSPDIGWRGIG